MSSEVRRAVGANQTAGLGWWINQRWVVAPTTLVLTIIVSAIVGPDANWDLRNYHYYNGRALATMSMLRDVSPAGIQTYLNPLVDVPLFWSVDIIGPYWGLILFAGVVQWLAWWSLWRLTGCFARLRDDRALRDVAMVMAMLGSGAASLAYTTFGDWITAALMCEAMVRIAQRDDAESKARNDLWAGVFLGLALGVKLTASTFALAALAAILMTAGARAALRLVSGAAIGGGLVGGPWMLLLLARYHSPVFPFYNRVFRAESAPLANFDDARYGARSLRDLGSFPIDMLRGGIRYAELEIQEWRFAGLLALIAALTLVESGPRLRGWIETRSVRSWTVFMLVAYFSWLLLFGIYRYFLFAELVASILVVVLVAELVRDRTKAVVLGTMTIMVGLAFQTLPSWGRGEVFENPDLDAVVATMTSAPPHVIFVGVPPFGYLTESFPTSARFASLSAYQFGELRLAGELGADLDAFIARGQADNSLYVVGEVGTLTALPTPIESFRTFDCATFRAFDRELELCALSEPGS